MRVFKIYPPDRYAGLRYPRGTIGGQGGSGCGNSTVAQRHKGTVAVAQRDRVAQRDSGTVAVNWAVAVAVAVGL